MSRQIDLEEYKQIVNGVLSHIDEVCRKNEIVYFLAYGSLLGAIRHKGFIPWDDDVDIIMDRQNFEKLLSCMREEKHPYYKMMWFTEQKDYDLPLPKVVDSRTELKQSGRRSNLTIGAWVDVLIVDDVPDDIDKQRKVLKKFDFYERIWSWSQYKLFSVKNSKSFRSFLVNLFFKILSIPGSRFWSKKMYRLSNRYNGKGYGSFSALVFSGGKRKAYLKKWLGKGIYVEFEGKQYIGPENWDAYLNNAYGDYMKLPPKEKQVSNHGFNVYYKD